MKILTFVLGSIRTNSYLCVDPDTSKCVVIDPGCDGEGIYGKIAERNLTLEYILFTHGHFDHIMASAVLKEKTGAKIAVHSLDHEMLYDPMKSYAMQFSGSNFVCGADLVFNDGDVITCGNMSFKVIHTPGHTKGSSTFMTTDALFTGDTLFKLSVGNSFPPYGNMSEEIDSIIKKIYSLDDMICYPGHGESTSIEYEKKFNPYTKGETWI